MRDVGTYPVSGVCRMGYKIEYTFGQTNVERCKEKKKSVRWVVLSVLSLMVLSIGAVRETVLDVLIPGDDEITIQAVSDMVHSFREGSDIGEALEGFCREVIFEGA